MDRSTTILAFIGGLIAALLVVLIVVLLTGDDGDTASGVATTTTEAVTSTTAATTTMASTTTAVPTTTTAPTTTTTVATTTTAFDPCAAYTSAPLPAGAADVTSAVGDVDGDGVPDQAVVYRVGAIWRVHVDLGIGFSIETDFEPFSPGGSPSVWDVVDIGSPQDVVLVQTGFGLPGPVYGVWAVSDCQIVEATRDGGEFYVWQGTGANHSETFACTAAGITFIEAYQPGSDPNVWEVKETPYDWVPGLADFVTGPSSTYSTNKSSALAAAGGIGC